METTQTFSKKEAFIYGWETFRAHWQLMVGVSILMGLVLLIVGTSLEHPAITGSLAGSFTVGIPGAFLQWWLYAGLTVVCLGVYDKKDDIRVLTVVSVIDVRLWYYILATILYQLMVLVGLLLLVVPGVIWGIKFQYYSFLILDRGMKPVEALKESARLTQGHKMNLFLFALLFGLLNLLGTVFFGVGMLVTMPVSFLALTWVYRWLEKQLVSETAVVQEAVVKSSDTKEDGDSNDK